MRSTACEYRRMLPSDGLPAVVRERLVGFCHAMRFFALLDCAAAVLGGFQQFAPRACAAWCSRRACAPHRSPSASPAPCGATSALRPAPGRWRRRRGGTSLRPPERRCQRLLHQLDAASAFFWPIMVDRAVDDPSATDFLPLFITMLMKRAISCAAECFGSGRQFDGVGVLPLLRHGSMCEFRQDWIRRITSSGAWRRTSNGSGGAWSRRRRRASRARCGSERPADPLRDRRESARPSAPAGCGLRRRCS